MSTKKTASPQSIQSMTGFASTQVPTRTGALNVELRSVNSRFLDIHFRMPDDLRVIEPVLREAITARVQRGKVECRVNWVREGGANSIPKLQMEMVQQLAQLEQSVKAVLPNAAGFRLADILSWPGAVEDTSLTADEVRSAAETVIAQALDALCSSRQREGERLKSFLLEKVVGMQAIVAGLEPQLPVFLKQFEQKLTDRITDMFTRGLEGQPQIVSREELLERIRQEVSAYSIRVDVVEELERLKTHFTEVQRVVNSNGAAGKRLDFLMQELNREANTLGSKANAIEQTQASVELKLLIEQMREQVQNIE
jgi:uncharacterized protein (TIGR00255 family)